MFLKGKNKHLRACLVKILVRRQLWCFSYLQGCNTSHKFDKVCGGFLVFFFFLNRINCIFFSLSISWTWPYFLYSQRDHSKGKMSNQEWCEDNCKTERKITAALKKQRHHMLINLSSTLKGHWFCYLFGHKTSPAKITKKSYPNCSLCNLHCNQKKSFTRLFNGILKKK